MDIALLAAKLALTPAIVAGVTWADRRLGPALGGWIAGLPLTSGPVAGFLAAQHGPAFAADAAVGMLAGIVGVSAFCLAYALACLWMRWPAALALALLAFGVGAAAAGALPWGLLPMAALALAAQLAAFAALPAARPAPGPALRGDVALRTGAATAVVLGITAAASTLGPHLSGVLSPIPVVTAVVASFTHARRGPAPTIALLRGLVLGTISFTAFFVVAGTLLGDAPAWAAFFLASVAALASNAMVLPFARADPPSRPTRPAKSSPPAPSPRA